MTRWDRLVIEAARQEYRHEYAAKIGDPHFGAAAPLTQPTCTCEQPGLVDDEGDARCWRCGRPPGRGSVRTGV